MPHSYMHLLRTRRAQAAGDPRGIGTGGERGLREIAQYQFLPELERARRQRVPIEEAFLGQALQPGALFGAAQTAATGYARQLFAPGGEVAGLVSRARGRSISQGFEPSAAEGTERTILQGATGRVGDVFAQQAGQLEAQRFGALSGAFGEAGAGVRDLLESLFTGVASAEQLGIARKAGKKKGLFGLGIGPL